MFRYIVSLLVLGFASNAIAIPGRGVAVEDYFEDRCRHGGGFITENYRDWTANLTEGTPLYFPMTSSLSLLRFTQEIFQESDLTFLTPEQVLGSCITLITDGSTVRFDGYCGQTFTKNIISVGTKVRKWKKSFAAGVSGQRTVALSDNKSWNVHDICWGDGQRGFVVLSLYPTLSECTRKQISDFVKAIGFHEQFFTGLKYDHATCACPTKHYAPPAPQPAAPYYSPAQNYAPQAPQPEAPYYSPTQNYAPQAAQPEAPYYSPVKNLAPQAAQPETPYYSPTKNYAPQEPQPEAPYYSPIKNFAPQEPQSETPYYSPYETY